MTCPACQDKPDKPCKTCGKLPPVLEIKSEECPILFHTVEVEGNIESNPPTIGAYRNVLAVYKEDGYKVLYNSDGIPSNLGNGEGVSDFDQLTNRPKYAGEEMTSETSIPDVAESINEALAVEAEIRIEADTALDDKITELDNSLAPVAKSGDYADLTGTPSLAPVATSGDYNDLTNKPVIDTALSTSSENAVQNKVVSSALDRSVDTGITVDNNQSTTVLQLQESQANLMTGVTSTNNIPLPVASSTQAGVMNAATFDAVSTNTSNINALMNGAVAITGLPANPTQAQITTAWQNATGLTTLMNRAGVYDVTNEKVWTYYTNDTTWHAASNTSQVTVNQFTNSSLGTIMGSTTDGQVFAENDGTGSVNGWDALNAQVGTNTSKLATIAQGAEVNVQSNWNEADSSSDAFILNKPANLVQDANYVHTDNNFTTTLKNKLDGIEAGAQVNPQMDSTLSTSSTNPVENQAIANEFEEVAYKGTAITTTVPNIISTPMIQDGAVTAAKLGNDVDFLRLTMSTTDIGEGATLAANTLYGVYEENN